MGNRIMFVTLFGQVTIPSMDQRFWGGKEKWGEIISEDSFQGIFAAEYKKWNGRVCKGFKMRD